MANCGRLVLENRRIIGKCVTRVTKQDIVDACSLQVCAGLTSSGEAATHAMHSIFEDDTDAMLLIDASMLSTH